MKAVRKGYPGHMQLLALISLSTMLLGPSLAKDDVARILEDISSEAAPCAGEIAALDAAVEADAADLRARRARGVCRYRLGRLELAWEDFMAGLQPTATQVEPLVVGAILAARRGDTAHATRWLSQARGASPAGGNDPQVMRGEIVVLGASGSLPQAWQKLDAALASTDEHPVLQVAATEMVALDPDHATPMARAAISRSVQMVTRHNRASSWLTAGQPATCLYEAEAALKEADPSEVDGVRRLRELAWRCAVAAEQVGPATRHLKTLGRQATATLPPGAMVAHVRLMRDAGQVSTALKMLRLVQPVDDVDHRNIATQAVGLNILLGDLDAALAAATAQSSPVSRTKLAKALVAAKRTTDAVELLDRTCPQMPSPDASECAKWTARLKADAPR